MVTSTGSTNSNFIRINIEFFRSFHELDRAVQTILEWNRKRMFRCFPISKIEEGSSYGELQLIAIALLN